MHDLLLFESGFQINNRGLITSINWADVNEINAYKRDLITADQICLEIKVGDNLFYCTEDFNGWQEFVDMLRKQLPEIDSNWLMQVAIPAFETSKTRIFRKEERKS